ncbi:MAG: PH domain-containing protein [Actinomycetota bacterium]|jgi:hypothetical protein|nr:PH domain-containing protein [Actinomycetota bacterium]
MRSSARRTEIESVIRDQYADEPVLFRTGPHWVSQDLTLGLAGVVLAMSALAFFVEDKLWPLVLLPTAPLVVKLVIDLPRYWRFETILTSRRLFINVGLLRDVYHTVLTRHIRSVEVRQNVIGKALGFGRVTVVLRGTSPDGVVHSGIYVLDYVRRPRELGDAILRVLETLPET